jgi:hypothetical protein
VKLGEIATIGQAEKFLRERLNGIESALIPMAASLNSSEDTKSS